MALNVDFSRQKNYDGIGYTKQYNQWWIQGLEVCWRRPFKNSQPTHFFFFFFFFFFLLFWSKVSFVCFDDREISTSEIAICSLLSHHILTPNVLICLTSAAIRRSVVYWSLDRPFICLPSSKMTFSLTLNSINFVWEFQNVVRKTNAGNIVIFAGDFHVKAMKKPIISGLNPEIWQACGPRFLFRTTLIKSGPRLKIDTIWDRVLSSKSAPTSGFYNSTIKRVWLF